MNVPLKCKEVYDEFNTPIERDSIAVETMVLQHLYILCKKYTTV